MPSFRCTRCGEVSPSAVDRSCHETVGRPCIWREEPYEKVDHPKHYNDHPSGVECITVVEHMTFNTGNAMKYLWRAGLKPGTATVEDLKKAAWYIAREIERLSKS